MIDRALVERLTSDNFIEYAMRVYQAPLFDEQTFSADLKRFRHLAKICSSYKRTGKLRVHYVLNHLIVLKNVFDFYLPRMLFVRLEKHFSILKPFLIVLQCYPKRLVNVKTYDIVELDEIPMDMTIVHMLREHMRRRSQ